MIAAIPLAAVAVPPSTAAPRRTPPPAGAHPFYVASSVRQKSQNDELFASFQTQDTRPILAPWDSSPKLGRGLRLPVPFGGV